MAADVTTPLWRALALFRVAALGYATLLYADVFDDYARPAGGWLVLAGMAAWTAAVTAGYRRTRGHDLRWLVADLAVAAAAVLATRLVDQPARIEAGEQTLPTVWAAAPVLAWAVARGWRGGLLAGAAVGVADVVERQAFARTTMHNVVLLVLLGLVAGYAVDLFRRSEESLARALRIEAATRERERLARDIHDGVLQVLALVQRRGRELGGEAAELARLAGDQEVALRSLVSTAAPEPAGGDADLRSLLAPYASATVTVSAPATPVPLDPRAAGEVAAAVRAALDNVAAHAGPQARAWVLLEDDGDAVTVTVRDDGTGMPRGRLEEALAAGRLGVERSIRGRLRDLGGEAVWASAPGQGTEVELRLPRDPQSPPPPPRSPGPR